MRVAWNGSILSLMALASLINPPRPMVVTARESQVATVSDTSIALVCNTLVLVAGIGNQQSVRVGGCFGMQQTQNDATDYDQEL